MSEPNDAKPMTPKEMQSQGTSPPLPLTLCSPSVWPVTMSFGITLFAFGVVTTWIISVAGFLTFLFSAYGWFEDLRHD